LGSAIYLYTKFYLNANSSYKVIFQTRYRKDGRMDRGTDGQRGDDMLPPLGSIKMLIEKGIKITAACMIHE